MKLNIANPETGASKLIEIDDEKKLRIFFDKNMSTEVEADALGDEFKGYVFKIAGGNDKQGFPMMQGVHVNGRVRLLLKKGQKCFRERRDGERKRKSIRGCIVGPDMAVLSLIIVKKGEGELPGLTDKYIPRPFGPKRASKIRKLFNLTKEDDVSKYVLKKVLKYKTKAGEEKETVKIPKIQRLLTKRKLAAWRHKKLEKQKRQTKNKLEHEAYAKLLEERENQRARRQSVVAARRSSQKGESQKGETEEKRGSKRLSDKQATKKDGEKKPKPAKPSAKKAPAGKKAPGAKKPAAKKAPGAKPAGGKREKPEKPAGEKPAGEKPAKPAKKPAADKPAKPAGEKKPAADKPAKPAGEKKPAADKPAKPAAEKKEKKPAAEKPAKPAASAKPAAKAPAKKAAKK